MLLGNNHKELIGYLKYVQGGDEILQWSLTAAGGVLLIILVVAVLVCIYRKRQAAREPPDDGSVHLPEDRNRSMKLSYTGNFQGVGAPDSGVVLGKDYTATGIGDAMSLRPRNAGETGLVRWNTSALEDASSLTHTKQHGAAHATGDVDGFSTTDLRPDAQRDHEPDAPICGVYVVPT